MSIARSRNLSPQINKVFTFYPIQPIQASDLTFHKGVELWAKKYMPVGKLDNALSKMPSFVDIDAVMGIEIEAENIVFQHNINIPHWTITKDDSLRNNGREFISLPAKPAAMRVLLALLYASFPYILKDTPEFSWRTSIHAHLNFRDDKVEQLINFLILYILFEDSLFSFVGNDRKENNFCVPLQETEVPTTISRFLSNQESFQGMIRSWDKYTALNARPLCFNDHAGSSLSQAAEPTAGKGTLEFRQLEGTHDLVKIGNWINLILRLQQAARCASLIGLQEKILAIRDRDSYMTMLANTFGPQTTLLKVRDFKPLLQSSIATAKECLYPTPDIKELLEDSTKAAAGLKEMVKIRTQFRKEEKKNPNEIVNRLIATGFLPNSSAALWTINTAGGTVLMVPTQMFRDAMKTEGFVWSKIKGNWVEAKTF